MHTKLALCLLSLIAGACSSQAAEHTSADPTLAFTKAHEGMDVPVDVSVVVDTKSSVPFPHYWETMFDSSNFRTTVRADWREHMMACARDLGYKMVRFHNLFAEAMSVSTGPGQFCFVSLDSTFDFLVYDAKVRPYVELSYTPVWLAESQETLDFPQYNTNRMSNVTAFAEVVAGVAEHVIDRYGIEEVSQWRWALWNEPDLFSDWMNTPETFTPVWIEVAKALERVGGGRLRFGGPGTATTQRVDFIYHLLDEAEKEGVKVHFVSSHCYGNNGDPPGSLQICYDSIAAAAKIAEEHGLPHLTTEYGPDAGFEWDHDSSDSATFMLASILKFEGTTESLGFWAMSDIYEELGWPTQDAPFHNGFGLINYQGVPKPVYRVLELLHHAGDKKLMTDVVAVSDDKSTCEDTLVVLALEGEDDRTTFIANHAAMNQTVSKPSCLVKVEFGAEFAGRAVGVKRIDDQHTNPKAAWRDMGMPQYPTRVQVEDLKHASFVDTEYARLSADGSLALELPLYGVVAVDLI